MRARSTFISICAGVIGAAGCGGGNNESSDAGAPDASYDHVDCTGAAPETICVPTASDALLFSGIRSWDDGAQHTVQLFRTTPDGTAEVQLTPDGPTMPTDSHNEAVRSPDGKTIVFVSGHEWDPSSGDPTRGNLYAVNPDGTGLRKLTNNPPMECREWGPRFAPDGKWLLFSRACRHDERTEFANTEFLFRIRLDGSDQERLVDVDEANPAPLGFGTWSSDGRTVYASAFRSTKVWPILVAYDVPTGQVTDLYDSNVDDRWTSRWPMVLPDGDLLVVTDGDAQQALLERIDSETLERTTVRTIDKTSFSARIDSDFALSPDGARVVYVHKTEDANPVSSSDFTQTIRVSNLDGTEARDVSGPFRAIRWVTWNPAPAAD